MEKSLVGIGDNSDAYLILIFFLDLIKSLHFISLIKKGKTSAYCNFKQYKKYHNFGLVIELIYLDMKKK